VDCVKAQRLRRPVFINRLRGLPPVLQPGTDEYQHGVAIDRAKSFEQHQTAAAIDVEVRPGIFHTADGA